MRSPQLDASNYTLSICSSSLCPLHLKLKNYYTHKTIRCENEIIRKQWIWYLRKREFDRRGRRLNQGCPRKLKTKDRAPQRHVGGPTSDGTFETRGTQTRQEAGVSFLVKGGSKGQDGHGRVMQSFKLRRKHKTMCPWRTVGNESIKMIEYPEVLDCVKERTLIFQDKRRLDFSRTLRCSGMGTFPCLF